MGNVLVDDKQHPEHLDRAAGTNLKDLSKLLDVSRYLIPDSDIVAHLVLAHQTQMHNLITLTNYQTRIALYNKTDREEAATAGSQSRLPRPLPYKVASNDFEAQYQAPAEQLVRYLLFANEAPLEAPITGTSHFMEEFAARGPRDRQGRSLRDFDLRTRIFKYPCSYLIYSEAFDALPEPAKSYVYHRLFEVLTGRDHSAAFSRITDEDGRSIFEILLATKPGLPPEWRQETTATTKR